jgi:hypothetical protein
VGREIRPDPHHYVDAPGACSLLDAAGFVVRSLVDVDRHPPGGWHWAVLADAV